MPTKKLSVFETLSKIDVSNHVEVIKMKKGPALKYVSWSWAWSIVKACYPDTPTPKYSEFPEMKLSTHEEPYEVKYKGVKYNRYRTVVDSAELTDRAVPYLTTPTGTMVKCTVTIQNEPYSEYLYVMDNSNKPIINPTTAEINKAQKRCMVKALALAGLGLNLYAGEDLPMGDIAEKDEKANERKKQAEAKAKAQAEKAKAEALEEAQKAYTERLSKTAEVVGQDTKTIEDGIKVTAMKQITNFDEWDELHQKSKLIDILDRILEKHHATEQGQLEEV